MTPSRAQEISLSYEAPSASTESYRGRRHAFANAVIRYYFGFDGFFGQQLLVTRNGKGSSHVYRISTDGSGLTKVSSGGDINCCQPGAPMAASSTPLMPLATQTWSWTLARSRPCPAARVSTLGPIIVRAVGQIALTVSKDDNPEIYVMSGDGSGLTRLTDNGYIDTSPSWSPDCSQMAFVSNRGGAPQIWVMNADGLGGLPGHHGRQLQHQPRLGASRRQDRIYGRDERNVFDIFLVDPSSKFVERLTQDQGNNEEPSWSPDGRYLAFTSTRAAAKGIYIMTADGRFQTVIKEGGGFETPAWDR